jgi:hypothetical protein
MLAEIAMHLQKKSELNMARIQLGWPTRPVSQKDIMLLLAVHERCYYALAKTRFVDRHTLESNGPFGHEAYAHIEHTQFAPLIEMFGFQGEERDPWVEGLYMLRQSARYRGLRFDAADLEVVASVASPMIYAEDDVNAMMTMFVQALTEKIYKLAIAISISFP